ncbi:hypothetical protein [Ruegeria halocynthiae]|uniref:hypothetical protein n=1 Tax=Ruegeria halocynthiae TaxID=985054 RepID=UPI00055D681A|nr:hypothetical protein [Ruegeria halocynthiae]
MIYEIERWEKPTPDEMKSFVHRKKAKKGKLRESCLVFRKHLSPLTVYKYLFARFGPPYGIQTLTKSPNDSDNLIHWDYLIKAGSDMLWIQGGNRDVHVFVSGRTMKSKDWVQLAQTLKKDFARCGSEMAKIGSTLEKWSIVSNRFAMIADACAGFHNVLIDEVEEPDFAPHKRNTKAGIKRYQRQVKKIGERATRVFSASLALDLITPILAESFINLIIFLTRKDELKRNSRQYDHYIRQPIDTRVFDLHLKCNCFTGGVDPNSEDFKAFKRVMDRRNYNLHGNIDPAKDTIETVYFDKFTPLYERGADPILELFRKKEAVFDVPGVLSRYHDVHSFLQYVLSLIEKSHRAELEMIMDGGEFGFDVSRKRPGRLFAAHEAMMLMPFDYDDELNVDWR